MSDSDCREWASRAPHFESLGSRLELEILVRSLNWWRWRESNRRGPICRRPARRRLCCLTSEEDLPFPTTRDRS
jgi:hypothetical protein